MELSLRMGILRSSLAALAAVCFAAPNGRAADNPRKFVESLRQRGYFDTASDYLDYLANDKRTDKEFKQAVPFEQAKLLIDLAGATRDAEIRQQHLDHAEEQLRLFLSKASKHDLADQARDQLGSILRFKATTLVERSEKPGAAREALLDQANGYFSDARKLFADATKSLRRKLDKLPGERKEERAAVGVAWLSARLNTARTTFELARLKPSGDEDRNKLLGEAAEECGELYRRFSSRLAGLNARFYEARCLQELGKPEAAGKIYADLIDELPSDDPALRTLKTVAARHAVQCWSETRDYDSVIRYALPWAKSARGNEAEDEDWLHLKLATARALKEHVGTLPASDSKAASYTIEARRLANEIAQSSGSAPGAQKLVVEARQLVAQLGGDSEPAVASTETVSLEALPSTFEEAYDLANEAIDRLKTGQVELRFAERETPPNPQRVAEVKAKIDQARGESFELLKHAASLASKRTDPEKLAAARYLLSWLHYQRGNLLESAVIGKHLARRHADSAVARAAARVALAALNDLYRQEVSAGAGDASLARGRLLGLADYVAAKWPDQEEGQIAFDMRLGFHLDAEEYDKVREIVAELPPDSSRRADGEIKLGHAYWSQYLRRMQQLRAANAGGGDQQASLADPAVQQELDELLKLAQESLKRGVDGKRRQGDASDRGIVAALSLAQIHLNQGDVKKAIALLEDEKIGPLSLLAAGHAAAQKAGVPAEIQKTALRAYVASDPPQLEKAEAAMNSLETLFGSDAGGNDRLAQLLVGIAYDLQQQLEVLRHKGNYESLGRLTAAIEQVLGRISGRPQDVDFKTLYWIAHTYSNLAEGMRQEDKLTDGAKNLYAEAIKIYEQILARAERDGNFLDADKTPEVKLGLAMAYRGLGEYGKAIVMMGEVLAAKPTLLTGQVEAARTYQMRGAAENPGYYRLAIFGGTAKANANIWGWAKLANQTARHEQLRHAFHTARYNLAVCRFRLAEANRKPEERRKLLELAQNDVRITRNFDATLGGAEFKPRYDRLMRDLQRALQQPVIGLKAFDEEKTEAASTAKGEER